MGIGMIGVLLTLLAEDCVEAPCYVGIRDGVFDIRIDNQTTRVVEPLLNGMDVGKLATDGRLNFHVAYHND